MFLKNPEVAQRNCQLCLEYLWDEDAGCPTKGRDGQPELRSDYGAGVCPPMCQTDKGCPKGTPDNPTSLNASNQQCYEHYKECRAVSKFPDDPLVARNAAVIRDVEDQFKRYEEQEARRQLAELILLRAE